MDGISIVHQVVLPLVIIFNDEFYYHGILTLMKRLWMDDDDDGDVVELDQLTVFVRRKEKIDKDLNNLILEWLWRFVPMSLT